MPPWVLVLLLSMGLLGCQPDDVSVDDKPVFLANDIATTSDIIDTARIGESCAKSLCAAGLECNDQRLCEESVVDKNLTCPATKAPVCGRKGQRKNGYLNACEAERHGAEVVSEGLCQANQSIVGNCAAEALSIGNCRHIFAGFIFSAKNKQCQAVTLLGCEAEIPFASMENCQQACL